MLINKSILNKDAFSNQNSTLKFTLYIRGYRLFRALDCNKAVCTRKTYPVTNGNEKLPICLHKSLTVFSERVVAFCATQKLS
jgi:hypothetical protein